MKTVNETFNGLREFPVAGKYFELISTVNPVDVTIYGKGDVVLARLLQIEEGVFHDRTRIDNLEPFQRIEVSTGALEAVKFFIGDGVTSNRSALSDVSDRAARLLGIVYGTLGQAVQELLNGQNALVVACKGTLGTLVQESLNAVNTLVVACKGTLGTLAQVAIGGINALQMTERGYVPGAMYSAITTAAINTSTQIFAPGSNTNGAILWFASLDYSAAGAGDENMLTKASAPANASDGNLLLCTRLNAAGTLHVQRERPVFIAAGLGLYRFNNTAEASCTAAAHYTLL
jgi:hypothetical protein